jgi:hypothetical protein
MVVWADITMEIGFFLFFVLIVWNALMWNNGKLFGYWDGQKWVVKETLPSLVIAIILTVIIFWGMIFRDG